MKDNQKLLRIILTTSASVLFSVLVVFVVVDAASRLTPGSLVVEGVAGTWYGVAINTGGTDISTGLKVKGRTGLGPKFFVGTVPPNPTETLEIDGTVRATTFLGDGSQLTGLPSGGIPALKQVSSSVCASGEVLIARKIESRTCAGTVDTNPPNSQVPPSRFSCDPTTCTANGGFWQAPTATVPRCFYEDVFYDLTTQQVDACEYIQQTCNASVTEVVCVGD